MAIGDVVAQKQGASSFQEAIEAMDQQNAVSADKTTPTHVGSKVALTFGGQRHVFTTQTLMLYGILLADALLIYIAMRV